MIGLSGTRKELNRRRTMEDIERSFLELYCHGGIDGISISAICQNCEISRSTVYLYFEDKYAVLQGVEDRLLSSLWEICGSLPDILDRHEGSGRALQTIRHIQDNIDWYRALLGSNGDPGFVYRWKRDIDRSLRRKLMQKSMGEQDAVIQGVLFASALIGLYTYVIFECPHMPERQLCGYMDDLLGKMLG